jgi:hypothetical protein
MALTAGLAGCSGRPADVEGRALGFETAPFDYTYWSPAGYDRGWVRIVTGPDGAQDILAETASRSESGLDEPPKVVDFPDIPSGHTALMFYPTYLPDSCYGLRIQGVYADGSQWTLAVRIEDRSLPGFGCADALVTRARLLLVASEPPATVVMRVERERPGEDSSVSWW